MIETTPKNDHIRGSDRRIQRANLEILLPRGAWCQRCTGPISIANFPEGYRLRCRCYPKAPNVMTRETTQNFIARRTGELLAEQTGDGQALASIAPGFGQQELMTIEQFDQRLALVRHVVGQMQEDVHYGKVGGRDKSLWEAGAEYLMGAFQIQWSYEMLEEIEDYENFEYRYRVRAFQLLAPDVRTRSWEGSAWSRERKFWCSRDCPKDCLGEHGPIGMEPQMLHHNVRDRAIKRAFVALMKNVTGTTGHFRQTLDEDGQPGPATPKTTGGSQRRTQAQAQTPKVPGEGELCPTHESPWANSRYGLQHKITGTADWCNPPRAYKSMLTTATATARLPQESINEVLKGRYDGATWSKLTLPQIKDFIDYLKYAVLVNSSTVPPIDVDTGEILGDGLEDLFPTGG